MAGYWNEINMKETKEIIRNDSYCTRQQNALDEAGGRFSKLTPATVTGQSPASAQIPRQPEGSPWASNPVPPGELDQLGYDLNAVEPVVETASTGVGSFSVGPEELSGEGIAVGSSTNAAAAPLAYPPSSDAVVAKGRDRPSASVSPQPFRRRF
jgi:hypothetical protein